MLIINLSGCFSEKPKRLIIKDIDITHNDSISSSSGVVATNNSIYVVGDDNPYLYKLNSELEIISSLQLSGIDSMINRRVPSDIKADFECMGRIDDDNLLVISSGSINESRDTAYIINISNNSYTIRNMRGLFESIKKETNLKQQNEINIEAVALTSDSVYLFHRGNLSNNFIVTVLKSDFLRYFKTGASIPKITIHYFKLPVFEGITSGFSGACISPDSSGIFFTASLEATDNEVSDGEVVGSFIGYIPMVTFHSGKYLSTLLLDKDENVLPLKLEGISINENPSHKHEHFEAITVIDNDDGTSKIVKFNIQIK